MDTKFVKFVKKVAGYFDLRTSFYSGNEDAKCTEYYLDYERNINIQMSFNGHECMDTKYYADIVFLAQDRRFIISETTENKFILQENHDNGDITYIADRVDTLEECLMHLLPFRTRKKLTKTEIAVSLFRKGLFAESLAIFATFRKNFTHAEIRILSIAHEIATGHGDFYSGIRIDNKSMLENAKEIIRTKYAVSEPKE